MAGRKPKPTALHIIEATGRKCRLAGRNEPKVEIGAPDRPKWLKGEAKREWEMLVSHLTGCRVLSPQDRSGMISLCLLSAEIYRLGKRGEVAPASIIGQHRALLAEFGLTPSSRCRLKAAPADRPKSEWEELAKTG